MKISGTKCDICGKFIEEGKDYRKVFVQSSRKSTSKINQATEEYDICEDCYQSMFHKPVPKDIPAGLKEIMMSRMFDINFHPEGDPSFNNVPMYPEGDRRFNNVPM